MSGKIGNVTLAVADIAGAAPLVSPNFTGSPTVPLLNINENSVMIANTAYVKAQNYLSVSGGTLTGFLTLNADPVSPMQPATKNYVDSMIFTSANTYVRSVAGRSGVVLLSVGDVSNAASVDSVNTLSLLISSNYTPLNSPALVGIPTAPTALTTSNNTTVATTGFVHTITDAEVVNRSNAINTEVINRNNAINATMASLIVSGAVFYPVASSIDPTGNIDSYAGLQDAINRAIAAGGGLVVFPTGKFKISQTLINTASGVRIIGAGHGAFHDSSPYVQAGTLLLWGGSAGGAMMRVGPAQNASAQKLTNADVVGIAFQGTADLVTPGASYGLVVTSTQHSDYDIYTAEFQAVALAFTVGVALSEAANCEGNTISLRFRQINLSGTALQFSGSAAGNTCFCDCPYVYGYIKNGIGIDFQNCDNIKVRRAWIDRVVSGTGINLYFRSDAGLGAGACARVNTIEDFSQSIHTGIIYAEGLEKSGATTASYGNRIERFDQSNTAATVTTGSNASFYYSYNTSPIAMRSSVINDTNGYYSLANGLTEFWGQTTTLPANSTTTITLNFIPSRILDVSATLIFNAPSGSSSTLNWTGRSDLAVNKFDIYSQSGGVYAFRGKALIS